ncbi:MAG TPA: AI-2E family transporter, partial [Petrimonas sp.]|uniref:AI-2E family transporter n=1 Tax=Petrimonas sp. TaxID=2023866 RepID=UPI001766B30C|nr:AI-2E family transporter [Petrimonas sp.]
LALIIVILCIAIIVPQTADSISGLIGNAPGYIENFTAFATTFAANHVWATNILDWATVKLAGLEDSLPSLLTDYVLPYTMNITAKITSIIVNLFIAIVVSIYFLARKERFYAQTKKTLYAHMKTEKVERLLQLTQLSSETFSSFISGKLLDSLIIGILSFICLSIFHFPYALLVAVIIGITNIIPFFGPIIGAVPCFFIILIVDPAKALWFLLFILILQQVDGNIIGPKILGYSIGLSAIWIVFAIVIGNQFFGFIGMVIGVPLFAIIYVLFKEWSENKLRQKQMPTKTEEYATEKNKIRY